MRLFVALELPSAARATLAAWAASAAPAAMRRVPADNLHVTLAFLGSRAPEEADAVAALLPGLVRPLDPLRTSGALWLPPRRPGVLAVALHADEALALLHAEVVAALAAAIAFEAERRAFRPHVTVGRVSRGVRIDARSALAPPPQLSFRAPALALYRSHTGRAGARYEPLARAALR